MFDTQKNESIKNVIEYVAPKNNTMAHIMRLNNRISCVMGISTFGFKKYCKRVFNMTEIKTTPTFKNFLQAKALNSKKNKSYYQRYYVKIMRSSYKQAMIIIFFYKNMLARKSRMDYSPGISFKKVKSTWKRENNSS